jgi:hypothetical protein
MVNVLFVSPPQTSDMTFETAGSSHLHHAIAARVFKMFCLGMRISESMPAFSIPQLTAAQLAIMLDSPESFVVCILFLTAVAIYNS